MSSKRKPKRAKRPVSNYLKSAKANADLVPSLVKYSRRRKTLSRWEKGAITRAENKIRHAGGREFLFPLSKRQVKNLDDKGAVVGGGVRAARFRQTEKNAKLSVRGGQFQIKSNGRRFVHVNVEPDLTPFIDQIIAAFRAGAKEVWTWTVKGRSARGWRTLDDALAPSGEGGILDAFSIYLELEKEWLLGIAYLVKA